MDVAIQTTQPTMDTKKPKEKRASNYIVVRQELRTREDMVTWRRAIDSADNVNMYNREEMFRIYREVYADPHLASQWGTRKLKTLSKKFGLYNGDTLDETATKIIETRWFTDLMDEILESKLLGFRLIEIGPIVNNAPTAYRSSSGRWYDAINAIENQFVKPEWGMVVQTPTATMGLAFDDDTTFKSLIFAGKRHDYGIIYKCVKYVLFKNNCIENWSEWAEVFGMDIRVGKTDAQDSARTTFTNMIKKMGSVGYGVMDKDDELEFAGTSRTDAYKVYSELMAAIDHNISKTIFGQDVVSNNTGQVVGKVGENVSNLYGEADATDLERFMNDTVLPKLSAMGISGLEGKTFKFDNTEQLTMSEKADIDLKVTQMGYKPAKKFLEDKYSIVLEEPEEPVDPAMAEKKKKNDPVNVAKEIAALYADAGTME